MFEESIQLGVMVAAMVVARPTNCQWELLSPAVFPLRRL